MYRLCLTGALDSKQSEKQKLYETACCQARSRHTTKHVCFALLTPQVLCSWAFLCLHKIRAKTFVDVTFLLKIYTLLVFIKSILYYLSTTTCH